MLPGLALTFLVVPLVELYLIFTVSRQIGVLPTIGLLILLSVCGAYLVKREGLRAWAQLRATVATGRLPGREVVDGALVLVGGALLLTPGFLTDAVGLLLVLPVSRPLARRLVIAFATRRASRRRRPGAGRVIDVDVDADRSPPRDG